MRTTAPESGIPLPRPMISGLPPKRLYLHPDEQAEILKDASRRGELEEPREEWVLPSHLREKWSLRKFDEVFRSLDERPQAESRPWKEEKRVVLATLQDDSTIVYYVMQEGTTKPRQN